MKPDPTTISEEADGSIPGSILSGDGGLFSREYLSDTTLYDLLEEGEQLQYVYANRSQGLEIELRESGETKRVARSSSHLAFAAITGERVIFAVGNTTGDKIFSVAASAIKSARIEKGILSKDFVLEADTKTYRLRIKGRYSSDPQSGVQFVNSELAPTAPSEDGGTAKEADNDTTETTNRAAEGAVDGPDETAEDSEESKPGEDDTSEESAGETEPEIQFVTDPEAVPAGVHDDLREAAQLLDETDPTSGSIPDVRTALESAEELLSKYPDFSGVDGDAIEETIEEIRSQQESISTISAASTRAERKLVLARGGPSVPSDMPELAEELREAIEESKSLDRPHDKLTEQLEEVEKLVEEADLSTPSGKGRAGNSSSKASRQSGGRWEEPAADSGQEDERSSGEVETTDTSSSRVSRAKLVEELERIQEKVDGEPSLQQVRKYSKYALRQYEFEFDSVREAISAVTDSVGEEQSPDNDKTDNTESEPDSSTSSKEQEPGEESEPVTREDIVTAVEEWAEDNDGRPRMNTFTPQADFDQSDIYSHFDSWDDVVEAADIGDGFQEKLLDDLKRLEDELGYPPLYTDIDEHGKHSTYDYQQEFDSIDAALEEAGIDFEGYVVSILEDIVAESNGRPYMSEFGEAAPYSQSVIYKVFDTWDDALESVSSTSEPGSDPTSMSNEEGDSIRNELSERYELVRDLNDLCQAVIAAKDDHRGAGDDPMDEWATAVQEFYTSGPEGGNSYGAQQQERHAFSMREYRNEFGNGNRVTQFEAVPASEPTASVQALLDSHLEQPAETYHLPVDPETEDRFPVIVESRRALEAAKEMLSRLPETPESYTGPDGEEEHSQSGEESEVADDLTEVSGINETIAESLHEAGYDSFENLEEASMDDLSEVNGVTEQIAMRIKLNLDMDSILPESE